MFIYLRGGEWQLEQSEDRGKTEGATVGRMTLAIGHRPTVDKGVIDLRAHAESSLSFCSKDAASVINRLHILTVFHHCVLCAE